MRIHLLHGPVHGDDPAEVVEVALVLVLVLLVGVGVVNVADAQSYEVLVAEEEASDQRGEGEIDVLLVGEGHAFLAVRSAKIDNLAKIEQDLDHRAGEVQRVAQKVDVASVR